MWTSASPMCVRPANAPNFSLSVYQFHSDNKSVRPCVRNLSVVIVSSSNTFIRSNPTPESWLFGRYYYLKKTEEQKRFQYHFLVRLISKFLFSTKTFDVHSMSWRVDMKIIALWCCNSTFLSFPSASLLTFCLKHWTVIVVPIGRTRWSENTEKYWH